MASSMESSTQHNAPNPDSGPDGVADLAMTSDSHENISQDFDRRYTVGADLRMAREERGLQIRDVVDAVRIQARYLEALEDGRVEDLPGTVYALGFVRTYADYLGLDGAEMVGRFKEEAKGLQTQEYALPEPIDEGKVPTTAIIIIAVLLAGVAYGAWHFLYRSETPVVDLVPDVPDRLAALVPPEEAAPPASEATPEEQATESGAAQSQPEAEPERSVAQPPVVADEPPVLAEEPPALMTPPKPPEETPPVPQPAPVTQVQPAAVEPPAQEATPEVTPEPAPQEKPNVAIAEPAPPPPAPQPADSGNAAALQTPPPPSPSAESVSREPRVFGSDNADARIVINADEDAWVEVTDADGALLFSRVLRTGDSYRVPDRRGAVFVTGNAGGLSIVVDGQDVPRVGPAGVVRRNVRLDPEQLKAGTAWP